MPRCARIKTNKSIFHIMVRSISEIDLFPDSDDKKNYLGKMREYQILYGIKVYAYCLMSNHAHFIIDANGADISKVMHGINFSYAQKYNWKYKRHGHLFQDRFKSKIVKNERYLLALLAYIHNNPKDIKGYEFHPETYEFSSLSLYTNMVKDSYNLVDFESVSNIFHISQLEFKKYYNQIMSEIDIDNIKEEMKFEQEKTLYDSGKTIKVRNIEVDEVIDFISKKIGVDSIQLNLKYNRNMTKARAIAVILMRSLCNFRCIDVCRTLGNITEGRVSKLSNIGIKTISENLFYKEIVDDFIKQYGI